MCIRDRAKDQKEIYYFANTDKDHIKNSPQLEVFTDKKIPVLFMVTPTPVSLLTLTAVLAVMIPNESTLVTSSYVNVPAIPTVPLNTASVTKVISPVARST